MHGVMQRLDLSGDLSATGISAQISQMVEKKLIAPESAKIIKVHDIEKFFADVIGGRLVSAKKIYRELPFGRFIAAGDFFKDAGEEEIFIQGIIDLLFFDETTKNWVLLDYKTDSTSKFAANELEKIFREKYKVQINLYTQAIENLLSIKVHEKYLYLLSASRLIEM